MDSMVKVTTLGNSAGIVLTKEILALLKAEKGDYLYITKTANGIELTPYDRDFAEQMEAGRRVMRKHRDVLRELAK
jgi:putative addiction module antidote